MSKAPGFFAVGDMTLVSPELQWITPNEMRGQITAAYLFVLSLISGSAAPAVVVGLMATVFGVLSPLVGLRSYERSGEEAIKT
jgi:hypothetical protein